MNPQPDTPAAFLAVPGHTRLFRREPGGTYYLRAKVPPPLRPFIGKTEIRKSLNTKDYKEGVRRVKPESMRVDRLFGDAETRLKGAKPAPAKLSREEIAWAVSDWFVKSEARSEEWANQRVPCLDDREKEDVLEALKGDSAALAEKPGVLPDDGSGELDAFLNGEGFHLGIEKGSEDYHRLLPLFRQAHAENIRRTIDRILGERPKHYDPRLAELNAHTRLPPAPRQMVALGKFLDGFMEYQRRAHSETTPAAYALAVRILREVIGEETPLQTVSRHHLEKVFNVLCRVPVNMTQRYPGLTAEKAIIAAERAKDTRTLAPRTLRNNYILIVAVFNYAVGEQLISENPAKGRKNAEIFKVKKKQPKRQLFTPEELQKIFHAPLFTGCQDDENGYAKPGPNKPRRGRFWVPLLALFHGLRCNEACQLYAEDIGEEKGIPYLHVREDLDDEEETEKRIKNDASCRKVPIHPEVLKMGFMEYVGEIRRDNPAGRLFPTLTPCKSTGRFSKPFGKWFSRFLECACGEKPKGTFHSFRHHFRTQLIKGEVQREYVEALGGWKPEGSSEIEYRHAELPELRGAIEKVTYPGLDLGHLYKRELETGCKNPESPVPACRVRRRPPVPSLLPTPEG